MLHRIYRSAVRFSGEGRGGHVQEMLQKDLHAEVGEGGAEKYGRQVAASDQIQVELGAGPVQKLHLLQKLFHGLFSNEFPQRIRIGKRNLLCLALLRSLFRIGIGDDAAFVPVVNAPERFSGANGPVFRAGSDAQLLFDLIQQIEGVVGVPVHFIDKGKDRDLSHHADLEQLSGLRLHALGGVDHHDRGIRRHQRPVGILGKVLMARRIQDVDAVSVIFKLENGGGDGNSSLLLDLHPVAHRMAGGCLSLHASRQVDRSAVKQELFGQRGFSRVRMGNDGKGSSSVDFRFYIAQCFLSSRRFKRLSSGYQAAKFRGMPFFGMPLFGLPFLACPFGPALWGLPSAVLSFRASLSFATLDQTPAAWWFRQIPAGFRNSPAPSPRYPRRSVWFPD